MEHWQSILVYYELSVLLYMLLQNLSYLVLMVIAAGELFQFKHRCDLSDIEHAGDFMMPTIAVLCPAFNEQVTIVNSVRSLQDLDYPNLEILVINDGSSDRTLDVLLREFDLYEVENTVDGALDTRPVRGVYESHIDSRLVVIDKENGGKADALNVGLNYSECRLYCAIDADCLVEPDALTKIVRFYHERHCKVVALGGIIRIANDCRIQDSQVTEARVSPQLLPALQVVEYMRAFLCGRVGWSRLRSLSIVSGAFGLFERKAVVKAGGYHRHVIGEDMELVMRLHRYMVKARKPYRILFVPDPVAWTQAPATLKVLRAQRNRWQRGLLESIRMNGSLCFNPRYGRVGLVGLPYLLFFDVLGPAIELSGYLLLPLLWAMGWINWTFTCMFLLASIAFGMILSLGTLLLEEYTVGRYRNVPDLLRLCNLALLENFGYRQLNSWWRFKATLDYVARKKGWGHMKREAFT